MYLIGRLYSGTPTHSTYNHPNLCHIDCSTFSSNSASGGVISLYYASVKLSGKSNFINSIGSVYVYNSNLTLSGFIKFKNCTDPAIYNMIWSDSQGGAITSILSNILLTGNTQFLNNTAMFGGAILAFESTFSISGRAIIADNQARNDGGGIYLHHCKLMIRLTCDISCNRAKRGGAIHGLGSTIFVNQPSVLNIINNIAENGGGLYFEVYINIRMMNLFKNQTLRLNLIGNRATEFGGAIFVDDKSSSTAACTRNTECFLQYWTFKKALPIIYFSKNSATKRGSNILVGC